MDALFNRNADVETRRALRRDTPPVEWYLWSRLRDRQIRGLKFRRQHGIGPYFLDFYCPAIRLAIELDGDSHQNDAAEAHDRIRQEYLESLGIRVLRFPNQDVYKRLDSVIEQIAHASES